MHQNKIKIGAPSRFAPCAQSLVRYCSSATSTFLPVLLIVNSSLSLLDDEWWAGIQPLDADAANAERMQMNGQKDMRRLRKRNSEPHQPSTTRAGRHAECKLLLRLPSTKEIKAVESIAPVWGAGGTDGL